MRMQERYTTFNGYSIIWQGIYIYTHFYIERTGSDVQNIFERKGYFNE